MFLKFINYYYCNSRAKDSSELHFFGFSNFHHFRKNGPFVQTILAGNRKYVDNFVSSFQEPHDKFSDVFFFIYSDTGLDMNACPVPVKKKSQTSKLLPVLVRPDK